jgi:hypothetical protein
MFFADFLLKKYIISKVRGAAKLRWAGGEGDGPFMFC